MSVLPPEVHTALAQLLQGLQSTDNTVRSQAEESLNTEWVAARPDMLLMGLAEQMQGSQEEGVSASSEKNGSYNFRLPGNERARQRVCACV